MKTAVIILVAIIISINFLIMVGGYLLYLHEMKEAEKATKEL